MNVGQLLGNWRIIEAIGEGGQAHVFKVQHHTTSQLAVLKRLKNKNRIRRFHDELRVLQEHYDGRYFPRIYDADLDAERPFVVMEYFENGCLNERHVSEWQLLQKLDFYEHLVRAVAYANNLGIVHRDLKPENILVTADLQPRVTDFGICFIDEEGTRQTLIDEAMGSYKFMAPEMEDGIADEVSQKTDIYALGKILYWMLAGKIYNREKHRDPTFNMARVDSPHWVHFVNDYLDLTTNSEASLRPSRTELLLHEIKILRGAMMDEARYLDVSIDQPCMFCKVGIYKVLLDSTSGQNLTGLTDFGFNAVGNPRGLFMVCQRCGNFQMFRKDYCNGWSWKS